MKLAIQRGKAEYTSSDSRTGSWTDDRFDIHWLGGIHGLGQRLGTETIAALAAPAVGSASSGNSNPTLRNDSGHFPPASAANDTPAAVVVEVDGGFDWAAASVGAAGGLGLVLVAGGAVSVLRRRPPADEAHA